MKFGFTSLVLLPLLLGISVGTFDEVSALTNKQAPPVSTTVDKNITLPATLLCFNESTETIRTTDAVTGCSPWESSLGVGVIQRSQNRPNALIPELRARFLAAQSAAKLAGHSLVVSSGFRSYARQEYLHNQAIKKYGSIFEASKWVLPADISLHPWGLAIDVNYPKDPQSTKWLEDNGYIYGLCRAYANEWWHFEGLTNPGSLCPAMLPNASTTESR